MGNTSSRTQRTYPRTIHLGNGTAMTLRLMSGADVDSLVSFARSLPVDDLLFLRMDITDPRVVQQWAANIETGRSVTVLAEVSAEIVGYGTLHRSEVIWQRHIGEIRLQVAPTYRSQGLGRVLAGEMLAIARELALRKIIAQMTIDQPGARATFERIGFRPEALLHDLVIDRAARTRDLLVMAYDITGLTTQAD